jgi:hypothetical protein
MFYKIIKTQLIVLLLTNCGSSIKFVKSHTKAVYCFSEYVTNDNYKTCSIGYEYYKIHPFFNRIESTCNTAFINKQKRKQCESAGHEYFTTRDVVYTPPLFLLERFFPEIMLERYKNPPYNIDITFKEETPKVPESEILEQVNEYAKETKNKRTSHCYTKQKDKVLLLLDEYESTFTPYNSENVYRPIGEKIKDIVYSVMKCANDWN